MEKIKNFSVVCLFVTTLISAKPWSETFQKTLTSDDWHYADQKKTIQFTQEKVMPFTQLLVSWNAVRPKEGYYQFFVQVHNKKNGWGRWHQMMDWGAHTQQSYLSKSDGASSYMHVRLEMEKGLEGDGFKVKVVPKNGAPSHLLKAINATLSHFGRFKKEQVKSKHLASVLVAGVPLYSQMKVRHPAYKRICSPTACTMAINYLTKKKNSVPHFARHVFDRALDTYGNWQFNVAHAFDCCDQHFWFYPRRLNSFNELHAQIRRGLPVILSVRGQLAGAPKDYPNGHLLVAVGWDRQKAEVICHDPAAETEKEVIRHYPVDQFVSAWERSHRLVYWIEPIKGKRT